MFKINSELTSTARTEVQIRAITLYNLICLISLKRHVIPYKSLCVTDEGIVSCVSLFRLVSTLTCIRLRAEWRRYRFYLQRVRGETVLIRSTCQSPLKSCFATLPNLPYITMRKALLCVGVNFLWYLSLIATRNQFN